MKESKILFSKLKLEYIRNEMIGKEFENSYLECKEKSHSDRSDTDAQDESNYAKALSGFSNTSGGVLIFGLKATKIDDVDLITDIKPITDIRRFESRLRELESRIVERPIADVEYLSIFTTAQDGIIAIHIPESPWLPHRSRKDYKFYIRAGGTFQSIDLNLIEDLFFRRRFKPKLELAIRARDAMNIILSVINSGEASAKNPYIVIKLPHSLRSSSCEIDGNTRLTSFVPMSQYRGNQGSFWAFMKGTETVIHPDSEVPLLQLLNNVGQAAQHNIEYHIYADHMPPLSGNIEFIA